MIPHPPMISSFNVVHGTTLRFVNVSSAASGLQISWQNLLDTILFSTTAVVGHDLFQLVKIRGIKVWGILSLGTEASITVGFLNDSVIGQVGDLKLHTDTSMGMEPAYVSCKPARLSQSAQFQPSSASTAFTLTCPVGSVVDVDLSFKNLPGAAVAAQNALVGATVGALYFRGLDGVAVSGSQFALPSGILGI
jgi:hypothetical protein